MIYSVAIIKGHQVKMFIQTTEYTNITANQEEDEIVVDTLLSDDPTMYMYVDDEIQVLPPKPQPYMTFDFVKLEWCDNRSYEEASLFVKNERNAKLQESDWTDTYSAPTRLGQTLYDQWQTYRQALRDITTQATYPFEVVWPTSP